MQVVATDLVKQGVQSANSVARAQQFIVNQRSVYVNTATVLQREHFFFISTNLLKSIGKLLLIAEVLQLL